MFKFVSFLLIFLITLKNHNCEFDVVQHVTEHNIYSGMRYEAVRKYLKAKSEYWQYPLVDNLGGYVSKFTFKNCLIIIDNPRQINLNSLQASPIILRSIVPLTIYKLIYSAGTLVGRNISVNYSSHFVECPLSKYLGNINKYAEEELCYYFKYYLLWRATKPWNCLVQIALFPPEYYYKGINLRSQISHNFQERLEFPNLADKSFQIVIDGKSYDRYASWATSSNFQCDQVFLHMKTTSKVSYYLTELMPTKVNIESVELPRQCLRAMGRTNTSLLVHNELNDYSKLIRLSIPKETDLIWRIAAVAREEGTQSVFHHMMFFLFNCDMSQHWKQNTWFPSPAVRVAYGYTHIWLSLMDNFTVAPATSNFWLEIQCSSTGIRKIDNPRYVDVHLDFKVYVKDLFIFPYFVKDDLGTLKFVSCGERGFTSIPVSELTSVFDEWIWLLIMISSASVLFPLKNLSSSDIEFWSNWMSPVKVFLEQGDPFPSSLVNKKRMRMVVGLFLMAGIILSNSYKNTNVYNMIAPRKPIPYEFFEELLQDNFTVFTRLANLVSSYVDNSLIASEETYRSYAGMGASKFQQRESQQGSVLAISEVAAFTKLLNKTLSEFSLNYGIDHNTSIQRSSLSKFGVSNASGLGTGVNDLMLEFLNKTQYIFLYLYDSEQKHAFVDAENELLSSHSNALYLTLKQCNKVALILPEYLCQNHWMNLRMEKLMHAFVGKESYKDLEWMFKLRGVLPPLLPQKIKGIHEAGIWDRWTKLVGKTEWSEPEHGEVASAKMSGNVILIFFVWLSGIGFSIMIQLLEYLFLQFYIFQFARSLRPCHFVLVTVPEWVFRIFLRCCLIVTYPLMGKITS